MNNDEEKEKEEEYKDCPDHKEKFTMKCLTCNLNIWTECISSETHIEHKIKSLKFLFEEAKSSVLNAKLELNIYHDKVLKSKDNLTTLKKNKEDDALKTQFSINSEIKGIL